MHSLNFKVIISGPLSVADMGGTYIDHMFGAYFGLAVAWMLGKPSSEPDFGTTPDVFSLIGTYVFRARLYVFCSVGILCNVECCIGKP